MKSAVGHADPSLTSLGLARSIVSACGVSSDQALDEGIKDCILRGWGHNDSVRDEDFDRVLKLEKAPGLTDLEVMAAAAQRILSAIQKEGPHGGAASEVLRADAQTILDTASRLPSAEIPRLRRIPTRGKRSRRYLSSRGDSGAGSAVEGKSLQRQS